MARCSVSLGVGRRSVAGRVRPVLVLLALAAGACGGGNGDGDGAGLVAFGPLETAPPAADVLLGPGDPVASTTTAVVSPTTAATAPVAELPGPTSTVAATASPPTTRAPVPLPADPAAVVLRVSRLGGYPFPGSSSRVQPIELHAGGRLVRPAPFPPPDPASAHHRLEAFEVTVAEVQALVAAAEDGGATAPPADLGSNPNLADWGVQVFEVDRPGHRSTLVVRDLERRSTDAPNLTPDQRARRRTLLDLVARLESTGRPTGSVREYVRAVATGPRTGAGATTTAPHDLRPWPGPPLQVGSSFRCVVLPAADMDRRVPGWSSATTSTGWQSGSEVLGIGFYDATTPGEGCTAPPG